MNDFHLIVGSLDGSIFSSQSDVRRRFEHYAKNIGKIDVIVFSGKTQEKVTASDRLKYAGHDRGH